jgi:HSP20 family protein
VFFRVAGPLARPAARENNMTVMTGLDMFEDLRAAQEEMLRTAWGRGQRPGQQHDAGAGRTVWAPAVDISENTDAYRVAMELPGVSADEVEITFEDGLLTVQGERHFPQDPAGEKLHRSERFYGAFRRSITLPNHVQADKIKASAQDGVLQILMPKAPEVRAKRIQVHAGQGQTALKPGTAAKNGS